MPNYRYNMPEYERRNNLGRTRAACAVPQNACEAARGSREVNRNSREMRNSREGRNSCEVPRRESRNTEEMSCAVSDRYDSLSGMPIAMAYVPWQMWRKIYDAEKAFCRGTIFEELDKPFQGMGGVR